MAVTIANQQENHRGLYAEVTGDGATTVLVFTHHRGVHAGQTATATVLTGPSATRETKSGSGGFHYPASGTAVTVSSVVVTSTTITVTTSAAITNATVAYVAVVFDQSSSTN
jgi:hypothetical protein